MYARGCDLILLLVFRALEVCARRDWGWLAVRGRASCWPEVGTCVSALAFFALRDRACGASGSSERFSSAAAGSAVDLRAPACLTSQRARSRRAVGGAGGRDRGSARRRARRVLLDGGPLGAGEAIVSFLHERGVLRLSRVLASHPDADHVTGIADVLAQVAADSLHDPGQWGGGGPYRRLLEMSVSAGAGYRALAAGDRLRVGEVTLDVLWPQASDVGRDPYWDGFATNDASLVILLAYRGLRVLLTGDVGAEVERELVRASTAIARERRAEGGATTGKSRCSAPRSSSQWSSPTSVCVGRVGNTFGHPHEEVPHGSRSRESCATDGSGGGVAAAETTASRTRSKAIERGGSSIVASRRVERGAASSVSDRSRCRRDGSRVQDRAGGS